MGMEQITTSCENKPDFFKQWIENPLTKEEMWRTLATLLDNTPEGRKTNSTLREKKLRQTIDADLAIELLQTAKEITHRKYELPEDLKDGCTFNDAWRLAQWGDIPPGQVWKLAAAAEVRKPKYELVQNQIRLDGKPLRIPIFDYGTLKRYAELYKENVDHNRILLQDTEGRKLRFIPYTHVLSERYIIALLCKFHKHLHEGLGVTLTLRNTPESSIYENRKRLTSCFNVLLGRIRRHCEENGLKMGRYFWIAEIGNPPKQLKNGKMSIGYMTHLHVIFYDLPFLSQEWISQAWYEITGDSKNVWVSPRNVRAKRYVEKYLTKALKGDLTPTLVCNWACHTRVWGTSRDFFEKTEKEEYASGEWIVIGIVTIDLEGVYEIDDGSDYMPVDLLFDDGG